MKPGDFFINMGERTSIQKVSIVSRYEIIDMEGGIHFTHECFRLPETLQEELKITLDLAAIDT
jgi:hypothetical protein